MRTNTKKYNENRFKDDQLTIEPIAAGNKDGGTKWYRDACHQERIVVLSDRVMY